MGYNGDGYGVGNEDKVGTGARGSENEGGHTGLGPDWSYPELTGVVSERVLTRSPDVGRHED